MRIVYLSCVVSLLVVACASAGREAEKWSDYNKHVRWITPFSNARETAKRENKLMLLCLVKGSMDDEFLPHVEVFRRVTLARPEVAKVLEKSFISCWRNVDPMGSDSAAWDKVSREDRTKLVAESIRSCEGQKDFIETGYGLTILFLTPDGSVIHALQSNLGYGHFLRELEMIRKIKEDILDIKSRLPSTVGEEIRKLHDECAKPYRHLLKDLKGREKVLAARKEAFRVEHAYYRDMENHEKAAKAWGEVDKIHSREGEIGWTISQVENLVKDHEKYANGNFGKVEEFLLGIALEAPKYQDPTPKLSHVREMYERLKKLAANRADGQLPEGQIFQVEEINKILLEIRTSPEWETEWMDFVVELSTQKIDMIRPMALLHLRRLGAYPPVEVPELFDRSWKADAGEIAKWWKDCKGEGRTAWLLSLLESKDEPKRRVAGRELFLLYRHKEENADGWRQWIKKNAGKTAWDIVKGYYCPGGSPELPDLLAGKTAGWVAELSAEEYQDLLESHSGKTDEKSLKVFLQLITSFSHSKRGDHSFVRDVIEPSIRKRLSADPQLVPLSLHYKTYLGGALSTERWGIPDKEIELKGIEDGIRHLDPKIRLQAINLLTCGNVRGEETLLEEALVDLDDNVRQAAVMAITRNPFPRASDALKRLGNDPSRPVRHWVAQALAKVGGGDPPEELKKLLDASDAATLIAKIDALGESGAAGDVPHLLELYEAAMKSGASQEVQGTIGAAIMKIALRNGDSAEALETAGRIMNERGGAVVARMNAALNGTIHQLLWKAAKENDDKSIVSLEKLFGCKDAAWRATAYETLNNYPGNNLFPAATLMAIPVVENIVARGLVDGEERIRRASVTIFSRQDTKAMTSLLESRDKSVREAALAAIEKSGKHMTVTAALKKIALEDSDPAFRIRALGLIPRDEEMLLRILKDREPKIRSMAIENMGATKKITFIPDIVEMLQDKEPPVRISAVKALGTIGHRSALSFLEKTAKGDSSDDVRKTARETLDRFGKE